MRESLANTSQFSFLSGGWKQAFFFPEEQFTLEFTQSELFAVVKDGRLADIVAEVSE